MGFSPGSAGLLAASAGPVLRWRSSPAHEASGPARTRGRSGAGTLRGISARTQAVSISKMAFALEWAWRGARTHRSHGSATTSVYATTRRGHRLEAILSETVLSRSCSPGVPLRAAIIAAASPSTIWIRRDTTALAVAQGQSHRHSGARSGGRRRLDPPWRTRVPKECDLLRGAQHASSRPSSTSRIPMSWPAFVRGVGEARAATFATTASRRCRSSNCFRMSMTSTVLPRSPGFEALLRGLSVTCHGAAVYAAGA